MNNIALSATAQPRREFAGLSPYQWLVFFAAWLGWGFDVFDGLLFNYVSPICVPDLLHLTPGTAVARGATTFWTGALTSALLLGWALGGVLFGRLADRIGRTRTLLITMLTYALATLACAFAPNLAVLAAFRFIASLGIGGEWAAGAALVAETVPEKKRVQFGALLYTSAPAGLFLATYVNDLFTRQLSVVASNPSLSWRLVFATGLIPAIVAVAIRWKVKEPERWADARTEHAKLADLFTPAMRGRTLGGLAMAATALVTWWSCNAFIPMIARLLAEDAHQPPAKFVTIATSAFNLGGLLGTLLTVPIALWLGRRAMFALYFLSSSAAIWLAFGFAFPPETRLYLIGLIGLTVFGVFGSFTFYLPELFPTHLRGTGSGFCYNTGRIITAAGPIAVGVIAQSGQNPIDIVRWVALAPLMGIVFLLLGLGAETRGETLA